MADPRAARVRFLNGIYGVAPMSSMARRLLSPEYALSALISSTLNVWAVVSSRPGSTGESLTLGAGDLDRRDDVGLDPSHDVGPSPTGAESLDTVLGPVRGPHLASCHLSYMKVEKPELSAAKESSTMVSGAALRLIRSMMMG